MPTACVTGGASGKYVLVCMLCDAELDPAPVYRCPSCSGALEPRLALEHAGWRGHETPERAYFDFLPLSSAELVDDGLTVRTPCRPAPKLGAAIGVPNLWCKDESRQPTGSTKDRLASVVLAVMRQFGVKEFVASSTGNTSTALARAAWRDSAMRAHFFCGSDFVANHDVRTSDKIALTVIDGSYVDAGNAARRFADEQGLHLEGGFFNWARREGLKIAYLEAIDQMPVQPDVVVQAISSGMGILAAAKGVAEYQRTGRIERTPRFLMVQQDTCAPMANAWRDGRTELTSEYRIEQPTGLATAILLGDGTPYYPYVARIAADSEGGIVAVSQVNLVAAKQMLSDFEGMDVCYASAATVAAVRDEAAAGRIRHDETVLVNLTGRARNVDPGTSKRQDR